MSMRYPGGFITATFNPLAPSIDYLIVAGGGGGSGGTNGVYYGGGGAGGTLRTSSTNLTAGTVYTVTVGAGGTCNTTSGGTSGNGGTSSIIGGLITLSATGGNGQNGATALGASNADYIGGTGTGSANDALMEHYQTHGMTVAFKEHLNSHNQYLQTFITLGIGGFIGLLVMLFFPLSHAISNRNLLYAGFIFIFALNIFVESMLETQAGNLFFAFFNALLFMNSSLNQET
jgi:hypothetical protein